MLFRPGWYRFQNPVWSRRNRQKFPPFCSIRSILVSLKKAMQASIEESSRSAVDSYRSALTACRRRGRPRHILLLATALKQSLLGLRQRLSETSTSAVFATTEQRGSEELKAWSDSAAHYYHDSAEEIKTLLLEVA